MTLSLLISLVWIVVVALSCAVAGFGLWRHRAGGILAAVLALLGAGLMYGFVAASVGLDEGAWGLGSTGFWVAVLIGLFGLVLCSAGWRAALRRARPTK